MKNYLFNYLIVIIMIITSVITFTSKNLKHDHVMFTFAVVWISVASIYAVTTTRHYLIHIHKNSQSCDTKK